MICRRLFSTEKAPWPNELPLLLQMYYTYKIYTWNLRELCGNTNIVSDNKGGTYMQFYQMWSTVPIKWNGTMVQRVFHLIPWKNNQRNIKSELILANISYVFFGNSWIWEVLKLMNLYALHSIK